MLYTRHKEVLFFFLIMLSDVIIENWVQRRLWDLPWGGSLTPQNCSILANKVSWRCWFSSNFNGLCSVLKHVFTKATTQWNLLLSGNINIKNMLHSSPNKFKFLSMKYYKHTKRNIPKIERILIFGHNFFKASIFFQKTKQQIELNPTPTPSPPLSFLHPQKQARSWI